LIIPQLEIGPPDSKRPHSRAGSPPPVVSVSLSVPVAPPVDVDVPVAALVPASLVEPAPVLASLALVVALVDPASPSSP
jgi:hypothetical protein